ncbi:MAG: fructosamine kinase family protein [Vibrio sp.]
MWASISEQLTQALGHAFPIKEKQSIEGGNISHVYRISDGTDTYVVKVNTKEFLPQYVAEEYSLNSLYQTDTIIVPRVIVCGQTKSHSFIVLEDLPTSPLHAETCSYQLGQQLAKLHQWGEQKQYGYDDDNFIGATPQPNVWTNKWHQFFAEQRIGWQLQLLKEKNITLVEIEEFIALIKKRLSSHHPKPALLHGDLWQGNVGQTPTSSVCYDPASYWGDRECDVAMTELFGGFPPRFYAGYQSIWPLDNGYAQRRDIYNLYHVLNHCYLFGGEYLAQATALIDEIQKCD